MRTKLTVLGVALGMLGPPAPVVVAQTGVAPANGVGSPVAAVHAATGSSPGPRSFSAAQPLAASVRVSASRSSAVTIGDYYFKPSFLTVATGTTVVWTNLGVVKEGHTVTGDGFDSGVMHSGATYSHTFSIAGTFDYLCTIHPGMKGTVTVTEGTDGGGGSSGGSGSGSNGGSGGGTGSGGGDSEPGQGTSGAQGSGQGTGGAAEGGSSSDLSSGAGSTGGLGGRSGAAPPSSGSQTSASQDSAGLNSSLPVTGLQLLLLAEIGALVLISGLLARELALWRRASQVAVAAAASARTQQAPSENPWLSIPRAQLKRAR